ncbi:hypothetical protein KHP62_15195 [Rhodobacteraceae bacterium NNCM2]|nr:hypothetical protein [Coraliihabitans acroporae]
MRRSLRFALLPWLLLASTGAAAQMSMDGVSYVGSQTCAGCHEDAAAAWQDSHHALAWTLPSEETVLGDFNDAVFEHQGITHRLTRDGDRFLVETDGPDGEMTTYPVAGVAGIAPLQQYLVETAPGRLQSHDVAWDAEQRRWYHLYPDQRLDHANGLHWTGSYKTWNARCAECHATGYEKRYDPVTKQYHSREAEIGVGCESCHGPGSAHIAWVEGRALPETADLTEHGFTIGFSPTDAEAEIQQCAGCHSRREPYFGGNPLPGTPFHDAYRLLPLRDGLYHADGSIRDEVYVYGSFLQSKMYANGVRCSDCHDPHSGERWAEGNAVCTQCHNPDGDTRFPSLKPANYDDPAHHFHEPGTAGAECKSCHMIERTYMGVDGRRDHSFRIPRPDLSDETGAPNACIDCHEDRDNRWAAGKLALWYPRSTNRGPHFSQTFAAARFDPQASAGAVMEIALDEAAAPIVRATALDLLRGAATPELAARGAPLLTHETAMIREAAPGVQQAAEPAVRIARLSPLLEDPVRSVRIAAARAFLGLPVDALPVETRRALTQASGEWRDSLLSKADFPESHLVLGGTALVFRDLRSAEAAFLQAATLDPQRTDAWSMVVRIRHAIGDLDGAREALATATEANPADFNLLSLGQLVAPPAGSE